MTLTQLHYIVSLDIWRQFTVTAEKCFVTQPTLSMQIRKLEEELGVRIFDRSRSPIVPTEEGAALIRQASVVLKEAERLAEIVRSGRDALTGEIRLGIIPTLAPYILSLFLDGFLRRRPGIRLVVSELTTEMIVEQLKKGMLDAGLLATPLLDAGITERPLFYEEFVAYMSPDEPSCKKHLIKVEDIDVEHLWLLEEGHCMRSQITRLCELKTRTAGRTFQYEAGSVETLKMMVESRRGITIIPELAMGDLTPTQLGLVRRFGPPAPVREISLVTHRDFVKERLLSVLEEEILAAVPAPMKKTRSRHVLALATKEGDTGKTRRRGR